MPWSVDLSEGRELLHAAAVQPITDRMGGAKGGEREEEGRNEAAEGERGREAWSVSTKLWQLKLCVFIATHNW